MATLREYFESDFVYAVKLHGTLGGLEGLDIETVILCDFAGNAAFLSCCVPGDTHPTDLYLKLLRSLEHGNTPFFTTGKLTLPSGPIFPAELKVENDSTPLARILARFFGDPEWISAANLPTTGRIFIYSEFQLNDDEISTLKIEGRKLGREVQFRSTQYALLRSGFEVPLAFISHDHRDKDVARKIALGLVKRLCPIWYDELSLKVGDNLRDSIEAGLKRCKKCVLILSKNFFANGGWAKREFDSIFTREILEEKHVVLPVWYGAKKQEVYDYSPSLLNIIGLDWNTLGEDEVCRRLYNAIIDHE